LIRQSTVLISGYSRFGVETTLRFATEGAHPRPERAVWVLTAPGYPRGVDAFGTVVIVLAVVAVVIAAASYWGSGRVYRGLGSSGLGMDHDTPHPAAGSPASAAEAQEEIRQMLEAKSARREARGEAPLDVDAELAALTSAPAPADAGLREEVRQLVVARNERRARQGKEPLDVEAEVERQLRDLRA
jgi:hypothetical protein